jgi:hypothetical protein
MKPGTHQWMWDDAPIPPLAPTVPEEDCPRGPWNARVHGYEPHPFAPGWADMRERRMKFEATDAIMTVTKNFRRGKENNPAPCILYTKPCLKVYNSDIEADEIAPGYHHDSQKEAETLPMSTLPAGVKKGWMPHMYLIPEKPIIVANLNQAEAQFLMCSGRAVANDPFVDFFFSGQEWAVAEALCIDLANSYTYEGRWIPLHQENRAAFTAANPAFVQAPARASGVRLSHINTWTNVWTDMGGAVRNQFHNTVGRDGMAVFLDMIVKGLMTSTQLAQANVPENWRICNNNRSINYSYISTDCGPKELVSLWQKAKPDGTHPAAWAYPDQDTIMSNGNPVVLQDPIAYSRVEALRRMMATDHDPSCPFEVPFKCPKPNMTARPDVGLVIRKRIPNFHDEATAPPPGFPHTFHADPNCVHDWSKFPPAAWWFGSENWPKTNSFMPFNIEIEGEKALNHDAELRSSYYAAMETLCFVNRAYFAVIFYDRALVYRLERVPDDSDIKMTAEKIDLTGGDHVVGQTRVQRRAEQWIHLMKLITRAIVDTVFVQRELWEANMDWHTLTNGYVYVQNYGRGGLYDLEKNPLHFQDRSKTAIDEQFRQICCHFKSEEDLDEKLLGSSAQCYDG